MQTGEAPSINIGIGTDEVRTDLLPKTDARTAVEREEDEGIGNQILSDTLVQEPVGVEVCG